MPHTPKKPSLKLRVGNLTVGGHKFKKIDVRGEFPRRAFRKDVAFIVSLFDCTDGELHPVISNQPEFREPFTMAYQSYVEVGKIYARSKHVHEWIPVAIFPPGQLIGPYGGTRKLVAVVRLEDMDDPINVALGNMAGQEDKPLWSSKIRFSCSLYGNGYIKTAKQCRRIESVALRLALAVAIEDGLLDYREINVVKKKLDQWIVNAAIHIDGLSREQRLRSYNGMMGRALKLAKAHEIDTDALLKSMRKSAGTELWYETLELCYDVISANGTAHSKQLRRLHEIVFNSGLPEKKIEELRDRKLVELGGWPMADSSVEESLGIDASWDKAKKRKYLRKEYRKWNGRMNMIAEGEARENAQDILNMIGEAYRKYTLPKPAPPASPEVGSLPPSETREVQMELFDDPEQMAPPG